jgi:hypothetical protein
MKKFENEDLFGICFVLIYILYLFQIVGWKCYLWSLYAHAAGCIKNYTV